MSSANLDNPDLTSEQRRTIISPHDKGIQTSIEENLCPWPSAWDISLVEKSTLCKDPLHEIEEKYYTSLKEKIVDININSSCPLTFTYTAMHGVSHKFMTRAFEECGFKHYVPVKEQMDPDPDFPTVKFPNPEEGKSALDLSIQTANSSNSTVILANDPDADRLAIAEKNNGEWKVFTGNEIGALLGAWLWYAFEEKKTNIPASDVYMISSTVSSKILKAIASKKGFNFVETLTGFKWMANKACELMANGKTVLFAFEEAIGFMCGTTVLDKDGVGAAMAIAQLCAHLNARGLTLTNELENIYKQYGYHVSNNSYYICHDQLVINAMFDRLRNFNGPDSYPTNLQQYKIQGIRDLTTGYDNTQPDNKAILPTSKSSHMITFYFTNGCVATLRTSGTEPKIKYYTELCAEPSRSDWEELKEDLGKLVTLMVEEWMQPEKNNLIPRSD
ncbi:phosphoglucomutase-2-like [Centruroides sculpturatus]|uniref:phosphoglucomutase-2-like n=1 Tax=Centruroides sculpturatus TaxID=218467 RepID=UPI000C6E9A70|nr:phosphoglucomutase-2-like [Centruroides sculpturatus]